MSADDNALGHIHHHCRKYVLPVNIIHTMLGNDRAWTHPGAVLGSNTWGRANNGDWCPNELESVYESAPCNVLFVRHHDQKQEKHGDCSRDLLAEHCIT